MNAKRTERMQQSAYPFCLLLVSSAEKQREIYFESEEALKHWHSEILTAQGFSENRLAQYNSIKTLGEGSFGKVILAEHVHTNVKVAIKVISKKTIKETFEANNTAFEEVEIMEALSDSENVLKIIESFEDDEAIYAVTRFMNAGTLFDYLVKQKTQPLTEEHTKEIIRQVATGLKCMHKKHIVHRDIKLDNILVNKSHGECKFYLADMGSGQRLQSADDTASFLIGTRGYTAPEIVRGKSYGLGVDIFSLGCLMHALLSARLPFWEDDRAKMSKRVVREAFNTEENAHIAGLSAEAKELLSGMLAKKSSDRLTVDQVLSHQWLN